MIVIKGFSLSLDFRNELALIYRFPVNGRLEGVHLEWSLYLYPSVTDNLYFISAHCGFFSTCNFVHVFSESSSDHENVTWSD